jgi:hypothetical protein
MAIQGFKVFVSGTELRTHLAKRAEHHDARAKWYQDNEKEVAQSPLSEATNDPVKNLREAGKKHVARAELFRFYVAHIPESARVPGLGPSCGNSTRRA